MAQRATTKTTTRRAGTAKTGTGTRARARTRATTRRSGTKRTGTKPASTAPRRSTSTRARAAAPEAKVKLSKSEILRKELAVELQNLRRIQKEAVNKYTTRRQAEIAQMIESLGRDETTGNYIQKINKKQIKDLLVQVRSLTVKPDKGRKKDIIRTDGLIKKLRNVLAA